MVIPWSRQQLAAYADDISALNLVLVPFLVLESLVKMTQLLTPRVLKINPEVHLFVPALFLGGFALLPWLWFANAWLFWPHLQRQGDPVVRKCTTGGLHTLTVSGVAVFSADRV